ncbi:MAG: spore germination protein GerW family protein, partial [Acidobacteriota bacterium]
MENIENIIKSTLGEIEKLLSTKSVIGEPVTLEGVTVIPLIQLGFGFGIGSGGGGGKGSKSAEGEGSGSGVGAGGGVKPVAMIVIDKESARVVPVTRKSSVIEKMGDVIPKVI